MLLELTKAPTAGIGDRGLLLWLTQSTLARGPSHWQPLGREPKTLPAATAAAAAEVSAAAKVPAVAAVKSLPDRLYGRQPKRKLRKG